MKKASLDDKNVTSIIKSRKISLFQVLNFIKYLIGFRGKPIKEKVLNFLGICHWLTPFEILI